MHYAFYEVPLQPCTGPLRHFGPSRSKTTGAVRVISVSQGGIFHKDCCHHNAPIKNRDSQFQVQT